MINIKRKTNDFLMLVFIGVMLLFSIALPVMGATYTYYYENFGSPDADGSNPFSSTGEIPYTYTEYGWTAGTAAVDASSQYYINTSTTGADGIANFTFNTSSDYDYFEFRFEYLNSWTTRMNHSGIAFKLSGDVGVICTVKVYGANGTTTTNRLVLLDYNNAEAANISVSSSRWYTVRLNPDYDSWDDNMKVTVYDITNTEYVVDETIGLNGNAAISKFYMEEEPASAKVCMIVDNLVLLDTTYSHADTTTNYLAQYIFPIVFAIAMLVVISTMLLSGNISPDLLITVLVVAIIGFVALMILTSI